MVKITTLIENRSDLKEKYTGEHGLSLYVETPTGNILFDTGSSTVFLENAERMATDLSLTDHVVMSHGHYDHSGGYAEFVSLFPEIPLWVGKGFFTPKYSVKSGESFYRGIPFSRDILTEYRVPLHIAEDAITEIAEGVWIIRGFPRVSYWENASDSFYLKTDEGFKLDTFEDEILLAVKTDEGLAVVVGCSHPGIINMLETVKNRLQLPIHTVIGGLHLLHAGDDRISSTIEYLESSGINRTAACHCTGQKAMQTMKEKLAGFTENRTGDVLTFDAY